MKYIVTVTRTQTYSVEVSAKDDEAAIEKAQKSWDKKPLVEHAYAIPDNWEYGDDDEEFDAEEA